MLDATTGRPAAGVELTLSRLDGGRGMAGPASHRRGRAGGRPGPRFRGGCLPDRFHTENYLAVETFYPEVVVTFRVREQAEHHHVPLLLSPFAYSTYRGS